MRSHNCLKAANIKILGDLVRKDEDEMFIHRWENVKNGMVVELEPKGENFPDVKHATFVTGDVRIKLSFFPTPIFDEAIKAEKKIERDYIYRKMKEEK